MKKKIPYGEMELFANLNKGEAWELDDDSVGLWKEVISSKYSVARGGWEVCDDSCQHSGIWKGVLSIPKIFSKFTRLHVGKGDSVLSG